MKHHSFRKRWMISLMLIEWTDERSREKKIFIFRQSDLRTLAMLFMDTTSGAPVVLTVVWLNILIDALQKGQTFFHRPGYILQNGSKQKQEGKILCTLSGPHQSLLNVQLFLSASTGFLADLHGTTSVCTLDSLQGIDLIPFCLIRPVSVP